jgi:hypothetical protein
MRSGLIIQIGGLTVANSLSCFKFGLTLPLMRGMVDFAPQ